ncbi:MAG TPA: DUF4139 domain-containing protein [Candidatus Limnocylindrales bacterium]|nr:DUF4139 domain-containing protein [Candidatus Limnocylindrales bacterium]
MTVLATGAQAQDAAPNPVPPGERQGVALTIYNQGTGLVQDRRLFTFAPGENLLNFTDVAAQIDPTSVQFNSVTDPSGTTVLEQNYAYDLVNSLALLNRYIDQRIEVHANNGTLYAGILLSGQGGDIILRADDGQVVVLPFAAVEDMRFPDLPGGLITRPTLRWLLQSAAGGDQQVELTYLTGGLTWTADYTVLLAADNSNLNLNGWVTLNNTSGATFTDALVKLIAGDVNRLPEPQMRAEAMMLDALPVTGGASGVEERNFSEYHLYEIQRPVTVADNETKQVEFVTATGVPANTFYVYNGSGPFYGYGSPISDQYYGQSGITNVQTYLEFSTAEEDGVGAALPAGRIRVYQEDVDGAALLIGENQIDHTPMGEDIQLFLGNAFDLVGERTQTNFNQIARNVIEETYEIRLRNRKDSGTVEIRVPETLFRWSDWEIVNSSDPYTKVNSNSIEFRASVEPGQERVITYTVRYTFPF